MASPAAHPFAKPRSARVWVERGLTAICFLCALATIFVSAFILYTLVVESAEFFRAIPLKEFFGSPNWNPLMKDGEYGIRALITGTLMIAVGSAVVGVPIGLMIAIYLSEYARPAVRKLAKPALELLAGIPSVVYGYFGLTVVTPLLKMVNPAITTYNAFSGSIVVGIMILPLVASLSEDAIASVPRATREAAYGLGASKAEVSLTVVLRAASSGIIASILLAISRAIGETMAVTLAAGMSPTSNIDFTKAIGTMTAYFVEVSSGDVPRFGPQYTSIFAVGLVMFLLTFGMNLLSRRLVRRIQRFG